MTETFSMCEYIWAVSCVSRDDGTANYVAYFTDKGKAEVAAKKLGGKVVQTTLYKSGDSYYRLASERVKVDVPDRAEVLAKLTRQEREALGIE